ncbi:MAG: nucleotidyltransferase [Bifidobacteriaceae bacterium]|jgi:tRNA nucleotidyltransferase (CCA-adding enzyme)|nr:nucleotidyltransferase [Bifidobacteriaceae bacterium]
MTEQTAERYLKGRIEYWTPPMQDRSRVHQIREQIEDLLLDDYCAYPLRETGSWSHGTAISIYSDVDYFAPMLSTRPDDSSAALGRLAASINRGGVGGLAYVDRPCVRVMFTGADSNQDIEITPAFEINGSEDDYHIPDPETSGWIRSNPKFHLDYVDSAQRKTNNLAKGLIRLIKAWNAILDVKVSELSSLLWTLTSKEFDSDVYASQSRRRGRAGGAPPRPAVFLAAVQG